MPHISSPHTVRKLRQLLVKNSAIFARWEDEFDQIDSSEWWHVIKSGEEILCDLSKKTRYQIRRSAREGFEARVSCKEEIYAEGYDVYLSSYDRYETFELVYSEVEFRQAVEELPKETEFWAVWERSSGLMVAFSENIVRDDACFYSTIWFRPEALKRCVGYLLFHEMNKHYLNERRLKYVSDGARNISHQTNIHEFLIQKFGFRRAYARLRVAYAPGVGLGVRLLYPFRAWFSGRSNTFMKKIAVLLEQERIRRACLD